MLYLGVDSGTGGVKAVALDLDAGRIVARARARHAFVPGLQPGHVEQHPADWARALDSVLSVLARSVDRRKVRGIGIGAQQHGLVALDSRAAVIRPAKLWCDTSTGEECRILTQRMGGPKAVLQATGLPLLAGYTAPKILWMRRHEPARYRLLRRVLLPHDYLNLHLTGAHRMERGDASGTGLLDVRSREWSPEAIEAVDPNLAEWLPALSPPRAPAGVLKPELARRYGLPSGVVVSAGGGDNMTAAIGTGAVAPGIVTASLGTSGTLYGFSQTPLIDPRGELASFCSSTGGWLPLACVLNAASATEQVRGLLGLGRREFEGLARSAPPGANGLIQLPFLVGERLPDLPEASGVLFGLTPASLTPGCIARSAMEGVALGLRRGLDRFRTLGAEVAEVRLTGGGARSALWRQILADALECPTVALAEPEAAALGAALQAAWACEPKLDLPNLCSRQVRIDPRSRCDPAPEAARVYRRMQRLRGRLTDRVRPLFPPLRRHARTLAQGKRA